MAILHPEEVLALYTQGLMTRREVVSNFISAASEIPAERVMALLPSDFLDEVMNSVRIPPESPDAVHFIHAGVPMRYEAKGEAAIAAEHFEVSQREARQAFYDGAVRLHRYLLVDSGLSQCL